MKTVFAHYAICRVSIKSYLFYFGFSSRLFPLGKRRNWVSACVLVLRFARGMWVSLCLERNVCGARKFMTILPRINEIPHRLSLRVSANYLNLLIEMLWH